MEESKDLGGRPTKYRKVFDRVAYKISLLGGTDQMLAEALAVNVDTIYAWKEKHKGFSESIRRGKIPADGNVAAAFYKRAVGFRYNEVTYEKVGSLDDLEKEDDSEMMNDLWRKKVVSKLVVPDAGAALKWLSNRQKEIWRDKQVIEFEKLHEEDMEKLIERMHEEALKKYDQGAEAPTD